MGNAGLTQSAIRMLAGLRAGEYNASQLLEIALKQVDACNPALNALIAFDLDGARVAARTSDARIAAGQMRPLEGLPISIKDSFDVLGMANTSGAKEFADFHPTVDAPAVARLRAAGAVIFAKSNVPKLTSDFQSSNSLFGTTRNPYDLERSPGGSSGGAAAAVAAGMSAFELGSDLGGSIRWPAHACGLFGLKPTWDLVPMQGHLPPTPVQRTAKTAELGVAGPIARSALDLELVLKVIAGPINARGPEFMPPARAKSARDLKIAVWLDEPSAAVDDEVRTSVQMAARMLAQAGANVDWKARPDFDFEDGYEAFSLYLNAIVASGFPAPLRAKLAQEALKFTANDRSHEALQARGAKLSADSYDMIQTRKRDIQAAWAAFFTQYDAILVPPAPILAMKHNLVPDMYARRIYGSFGERPYFDMMKWASLATFAHLPACVAPVSQNAGGLPSGVQIICGHAQDRQAIAIAAMLEAINGPLPGPRAALSIP
ncbi:MAG: hypothetical protein KGQ46_07185 [Hyphomicrobiales bacterium]|nr:hypothetical protein [Hyphomicrobiales bacterium]MDE2114010.1 hypothetical protein [Hyphomicrobiales bacterium]